MKNLSFLTACIMLLLFDTMPDPAKPSTEILQVLPDCINPVTPAPYPACNDPGETGNSSKNAGAGLESALLPLYDAEPGDVVITEIMADPVPAVALPGYEYIELMNRSDKAITLTGWTLSCNKTTIVIPPLVMAAGDYVVLVSAAAAPFFSSFGRVVEAKSFPALNDKGALIVIRDNNGRMIHGVEYSDTWHDDRLKRDGGWSLEMIDTGYPFAGKNNWTSSVSRSGGSPGYINSVNRPNHDISPPELLRLFPDDSLSISLTFSKTMACEEELTAVQLTGNIGVSAWEVTDPLCRSFILRLDKALAGNMIYSLRLPAGFIDMSGNAVEDREYLFALPEPAGHGDIRFNEILFNPWPNENDFVEFVNVSGFCIDASQLLIVSENPSTGSLSAAFPLSDEPRCILPGAFFVVCVDPPVLINRYPASEPDNIYRVDALPSLPDDRAIVILLNRQLDIIDRMSYDKSMHFPLISDPEGVSLEKVRPEAESGLRTNWHSAAGPAGWATPGAINSVFTDISGTRATISLSGSRLTPDSDGIDDLILIKWCAPSATNVLRITAFSENGYPLRIIANNHYCGPEALFSWDGTDDEGRLVATGIYVICVDAFDSSGSRFRWKKAVAVIRQD